jgi:hypothetical protein
MILKFGILMLLQETLKDQSINPTNNPIERYNRHLNEILPAHPSVPILAEALPKGCRKYVEYLSDLKLKKAYKPKPLQAVVIPPIPTSQWYQN